MKNWIATQLDLIREHKPLVTNITNYVVMNNTANALLAIGASPIMAHSRQEISDLLAISGALVINMGTLDECWIDRMQFAIEQANVLKKIIVLDPVGCGASTLRTETAKKFAAQANKLIIRANASEIMALAGQQSETKGVDAGDHTDNALLAGLTLRDNLGCEVVISGETDYVISKMIYRLENGAAMMPCVTGMGCTHSALTGAFAALMPTDYPAGLASTAILGVAGQIAAAQSVGPGSLQMNLLDTLYQLDAAKLIDTLKVTELHA